MTELKYIDEDILRVYKFGTQRKEENLLATLFWGDSVQVVDKVGEYWKLDFTKRYWNAETKKYEWKKYDAAIPETTRFREKPLLKIRFVDVGQGDAAVIESPQGKLILLDGGEGDYIYNYVSASWAHILTDKALEVEAIVATHGDADHFAGLTQLLKATRGDRQPIINAKRVYHSGLVKASDKVGELNIFGQTKKKNDRLYIVDLVDDLRNVSDDRLNDPFKKWKKALENLTIKYPDVEVRRLAYGDDESFDFLANEDIHFQLLGPLVEKIDDMPALPFLHDDDGSYSASHTVNGHSVVMKLVYGNVRVLFGADLNAESEAGLLERAKSDNISLVSEILKVPHHGSADFDPLMLEAVRPTVSVISSGDESASKEYIHPRAGLVGALGKYSNSDVKKPLIYVTEMVAFFERLGKACIHKVDAAGKGIETANAYIKKTYGIVHIRTDGRRVLVATHGGKPDQKESYAFSVDEQGKVTFEAKTRII